MSRSGVSAALAAFVVLTVALGASTAYLLATPPVQTHTSISTVVSSSTATLISNQISTRVSIEIATQTMTTTQLTTSTAMVTTTSFSVTTVSSGDTVNIAYKAGIGFYLVDGSGMTLYFRTADDQATGTSGCTGPCVNIWPVFFTQSLVLPPGLSASSFTTVMRSDGMKQIDYNGWPLYYYSGDAAPGDTKGQGILGIWFAYPLPAPSLSTTSSTTSAGTTPTTTSTTSSMATSTISTTMTSTTTTTTTTSSTTTGPTTTTTAPMTSTSSSTTTSTHTTTCYYYC